MNRCVTLAILLIGMGEVARLGCRPESTAQAAEAAVASPRWEIQLERDSAQIVVQHRRNLPPPGESHNGSGSDHWRITSRAEGSVLAIHPLSPAPVIDELRVAVSVRASGGHLASYLRVVLPRWVDERTNEPRVILVRGPTHDGVGTWERLRFEEIPQKLHGEVLLARAEFQAAIDLREAYVDAILIRIANPAGASEYWLGDAETKGFARVARDGEVPVPNLSAPRDRGHMPRVEVRGGILEVDGRPFFIRAIEAQGEPWAVLKELGFNTILLNRPPTVEDLARAKSLDLWLIASPPPRLASEQRVSGLWGGVIAWNTDSQMLQADSPDPFVARGETDADDLRPLAHYLQMPGNANARPLLACPQRRGDAALFANLLCFAPNHAGTQSSFRDVGDELRAASRDLASHQLLLGTVRGSQSSGCQRQIELLSRGGHSPPPERGVLELELAAPLIAGARGIIVRSNERLDRQSPADDYRIAAISELCRQLESLEPFLASGSHEPCGGTSDDFQRAAVFRTPRATLAIVASYARHDQLMPGRLGPPRRVVLPPAGAAEEYYRLEGSTLRPCVAKATPGGTEIELPADERCTYLIATSHPAVVRQIAARLARRQSDSWDRRLAMLRFHHLESVAMAEQLLPGIPVLRRDLADLENVRGTFHTLADSSVASTDPIARQESLRAMEARVATTRRRIWEQVVAPAHRSPACPLAMSFATLPLYREHCDALNRRAAAIDVLSSGACESLEEMLSAGWRIQTANSDVAGLHAEITTFQPAEGSACLRLDCHGGDAETPSSPRESSEPGSLEVTSPSIAVGAGRVVVIRGWYRAAPVANRSAADAAIVSTTADRPTHPSMVVDDSFGGRDLSVLLPRTVDWSPFCLLRAGDGGQALQIRWSTVGQGEFALDGISVVVYDHEMDEVAAARHATEWTEIQKAAYEDGSRCGERCEIMPKESGGAGSKPRGVTSPWPGM